MEGQEGWLGPHSMNQDTVLGHGEPPRNRMKMGRVNYRRNQVKVMALGRLSRSELPR